MFAIVPTTALIVLALVSIALIVYLTIKVKAMTEATDQLAVTVAELTTVAESAVAAIEGIPAIVGEAVRKALEDEDTEDAATDAAVRAAEATARAAVTKIKAALTENTGEQPVA